MYSSNKGIQQVLSYPYHPQGNPCETFMKPLGKALKAAYYNRDSAQQAIDEMLKSYRSTPHPATGVAPGGIIFRHGYQADFPRTICTDKEIEDAIARDKEQKRSRTNALNSSRKRSPSKLELGDKVILQDYPKGKKFEPFYGGGPAEIIEMEEKGVVVREESGNFKRRHKNDVKLYVPPYPLDDDTSDEEDVQPHPQATASHQEATHHTTVEEEDEEAAPPHITSTRPQRQRSAPDRLGEWVARRVGRRKGGECCYELSEIAYV